MVYDQCREQRRLEKVLLAPLSTRLAAALAASSRAVAQSRLVDLSSHWDLARVAGFGRTVECRTQ
jgi:hypothetical protein